MSGMYIIGLGTDVPPGRRTQHESWDAIREWPLFPQLNPRSKAILKKVLCGDNGIAARHLALEPLSEVFDRTPEALQARFSRHAPTLAAGAARRALKNADCRPDEIDAVIISTCTGYLCPGLTSYVSELLGLREDIFTLDLVGQGCGAAMPNLRTAEAMLVSGRAKKVVSICVEVCSAAFFIDDDPGVLISACLFGDGAAAAVLSGTPGPGRRRVKWKFADSRLVTSERDTLRFTHQDGMLRNILKPEVPQLAAGVANRLLNEALSATGIGREQITGWILHAGGRDVILALRKALGLTAADLAHSAAVLRDFGNISSPTVLFVLDRALSGNTPDGLWWMSSFGAGFSCHGALLEVTSK